LSNYRVISGKILDGNELSSEQRIRKDARLFLDEYAIFDRIINAIFIRDDGSIFTIRSDYEMLDNGKGYFFRKCSQKPALKVQYKQVSQNTSIGIKLFVTNLHLQTAYNDETRRKETAINNPVRRVIIQLGYFNQFPRFTDESLRLTKDDFLGLAPLTDIDKYITMDCSVLGVYPTKLPPDGETLFDCIVGNNEASYHSTQILDSRSASRDTSVIFPSDTTLSKFLFESITRRFPRGTILGDVKTERSLGGNIKIGDETIDLSGPMTVEDANNIGVRCYVTDRASSVFSSKVSNTESIPPIQRKGSASHAMYAFLKENKNLRAVPLIRGDFIVYSIDESPADVSAKLRSEGVNKEVSSLPAVYSISYSGIRTIRCPFTPFVQPFQELLFSSRYNIGNLISYFYSPKEGEERFFAINMNLTFSTMDDDNEMEILSTDSQGD